MGTESATIKPVRSIVPFLKFGLNPRAQKIATVPSAASSKNTTIVIFVRCLERGFIYLASSKLAFS